MFGESESESPRVPSPWDSLVSTPPFPISMAESRPLAGSNIIPRLVPEAEIGNIEYKLQLLSPSPSRFARLVTQLKWRLLEGGGQAYYELGVADSGALVGLPRADLEMSLETLEMMAGEIGASVIVVKEIEIPAVIGGVEADRWSGKRRSPMIGPSPDGEGSTRTLSDITHMHGEGKDVHAQARHQATGTSRRQIRDLRRQEKRKASFACATSAGSSQDTSRAQPTVGNHELHSRDECVENTETMRAIPTPILDDDHAFVSGLASLHVSLDDPVAAPAPFDADAIPKLCLTAEPDEEENIDDVFVRPTTTSDFTTIPRTDSLSSHPSSISVSKHHAISEPTASLDGFEGASAKGQTRFIVEALVVRKMSLEEAFLDFGGFSPI